MRAHAFLRFSSSALVAGALLVAGCTGGGADIAAIKPTGVTDQVARGYEQIAPGSEEELVMTAGRRVYFASGSAEIDDVARETLDLQAQFLNTHTKWLVKLQGFADDPGTNNNALSDKRAKAVMDYLAAKGVNPQRMWAQGYGKERLVRDCPDISCKALNRRVVTNLRTEFDEAAPQFKNGKV
ncbi:MAG TPA: OmpA family protein [Rhizobiaceae bacterium]|nr:OmpA family protein [Rhizobiaceae bacterium]